MSSLHNTNRRAHGIKLFQRDIIKPVLQSIREMQGELASLNKTETALLSQYLEDGSMAGLEKLITRQREIAAERAEMQAEMSRKWILMYAGFEWMAAEMADTDGLAEKLKFAPTPSPDLIRRVIVDKAPLHFDGIEVS